MLLKSAAAKLGTVLLLLVVAMLILAPPPAQAQAAQSEWAAQALKGYTGQKMPNTDEERIQELAIAYHVLFANNVIDGWGHVSVRSAKNPKHYFIARNLAPVLVTKDDIYECDENSVPIKAGVALVGERFIHGEIFRARPDVMAVVHSHAPSVVPFGVTGVPLRPIMHMAGFLPQRVPIFEVRDVDGDNNNILVLNTKTGTGLAKALGQSSVVLMRGHGMSVVAPTLRMAVFRAIYTQVNAAIELQSMALGTPAFLNEKEAFNVNAINEHSLRAWNFWVAQSEVVSQPLIKAMPKEAVAAAK